MNSSYGKSNNKTGSTNAFDFDLGLNSGRSKPLNNQKPQASSYASQPKPNTTPSWGYQPNKPAWTHQPAAPVQTGGLGSLSGPTSMVGDISGKSWNSTAPSSSSIGIVNGKNPNLFGDLLSSTGLNKSASNVPLNKAAAPAASQSSFSMGNMADSLPKTGQNSGTWGSSVGNSGGNYNKSSSIGGGNVNLGGIGNKNPNLGGPSLKTMGGSSGIGSKKDPFASLDAFGSKPVGGMNSSSKESDKGSFGKDSFGDFQNATSKTSNNDPLGDFGFTNNPSQNTSQPTKQTSGANDFDVLFSSSSGGGTRDSTSQKFSEGDDWGINSEFEGGNHDDTGGTTELEGLPPPPAGVGAPAAKSKGMDNYKQGQFADAIKWLSWAIVLFERAGDDDGSMGVLTCRASCYKEVGEYKKAVADCTKVLEHDGKNVDVLVQRALLYESMEKYKLGAEDLRTVMKLDPGNRVARSTVHRLIKMAG